MSRRDRVLREVALAAKVFRLLGLDWLLWACAIGGMLAAASYVQRTQDGAASRAR